MAILKKTLTEEELKKLDNEELKEVSGGYILDRNLEPGDKVYLFNWLVIDEKGYILQTFTRKEWAEKECRKSVYS